MEHQLTSLPRQRGYLLIVAAVLIVVIGFIGALLVYMFIGGEGATNNSMQSFRALQMALAGSEIAKRDVIVNNVSCTALNGNPKYTNATLLNGQFTVSSNMYNTLTTLAADIDDTDIHPVILLTNPAAFDAGGGFVQIGGELFNYAKITGNALQNVTRGLAGTPVLSHSSGANVNQRQCELISIGAVPTFNAALARRTVKQVLPASFSGFAIGSYHPVLVALGLVQMSGNPYVINPTVWPPPDGSENFPGSTIVTRGSLQIAGNGGTKVCSCGTSACLASCSAGNNLVVSTHRNSIQPDVVTNYTDISSTNLFSKFFSQTKAFMQAYVQSGQANTQYFSGPINNLSALNGITGKTIWVDGPIAIAGNDSATVGSVSSPVILIVNGNIQFSGKATLNVYGLLYVIGSIQSAGNSAISGHGMIAAEGSVQLAGTPDISLNPAIIANLPGINPYLAVSYSDRGSSTQELFP